MTPRDFPERRVLDPTIRADVFHYEGAYEVRTKDERIGPMTCPAAYDAAMVHNAMFGHGNPADHLTDRRIA